MSRLPDPKVWHVDPPPLTPEQQQRQTEVDWYLVDRYRKYTIVATTQGYSGDITDWVDPASIPGAIFTPPVLPFNIDDIELPPDVEFARTELELYPELRGPVGTTPIHRPTFWGYVLGETGATSLEDYLTNYQVGGLPVGEYRLYAGLTYPLPNRGASGSINHFQGEVEPETFSVMEVTVVCDGLDFPNTLEQVGGVVSRDHANFRDMETRVHVEFHSQGVKYGPNIGGWDEIRAGFVPFPYRPYGPGEVVPASLPGLGKQQEHRFDIGQDVYGNWWIFHNKNLLGYYPASLFDMLNIAACRSAWYGEVYDPTSEDWTWTDMGSGELAKAGYGYASYVREPIYYDLLDSPFYPIDDTEFKTTYMGPYNEACYSRDPMTYAAPPWGRYVYLGGPGGDAEGCNP
jgi:hypothetical protein